MVLLDTHIWLWSLQDAKRLGRRVHFKLTNSAKDCGCLQSALGKL